MQDHPSRRDVMVGSALTIAGVAIAEAASPTIAQPAARPDTITGRVTEIPSGSDASRDGKPLPDVLVSNGREVIRTDATGMFRLPLEPGQTIFAVKPAGHTPRLDPATKLPLVAYVHDPDGTPAELAFQYHGMPATGAAPTSLEFQFSRTPEPDAFEVLLLTDPQPESTLEIEFVRDDVVAGLIGSNAAFGITCGDLMFDDLSMYNRYNRIIGAIGIPWWNIGGNHDLDYEAPDARRSRDTWRRVFGATYYAFEYGKALFVMLDNVDYLGAGRGGYRGYLAPDQLTFVKNLLAATPPDRLIVLCMHIPLTTYLGPEDAGQTTANAADLLALLGDRPAVSFSGHTHSTEHHYIPGGGAKPHHHHVLTAVSGSWWSGPRDHRGIACADAYDGSPNGHHVLSISGTEYTTRFVPAAEPAGRQMRLSLEAQYHQYDLGAVSDIPMGELLRSPITRDQTDGTRLVVNLFDGGPRSTVTFAIGGGTPVVMRRAALADPFIVQVYGRHASTIKTWVKPQASSHIWVASLPIGLATGTHALSVVAHDEYGREHRDAMVLEVV